MSGEYGPVGSASEEIAAHTPNAPACSPRQCVTGFRPGPAHADFDNPVRVGLRAHVGVRARSERDPAGSSHAKAAIVLRQRAARLHTGA